MATDAALKSLLKLNDVYVHHWIVQVLVQVMAEHLFVAKH